MNRDLLGGSVHRQVTALYRLLDALRSSHPEVEIESCSSGGARIDAGILERTQRVWASDTNDPRERQAIQRYTSLLVAPEYVGSHLGTATAHTTGRTSTLSFRLATAFFGHAGVEWDLTVTHADDLAAVRTWCAAHKRHRTLLHSGTTVRDDSPDGARWVHGVVGEADAIFSVVQLHTPTRAVPPPVRLPGLDAAASYRVSPIDLGAAAICYPGTAPAWWGEGSIVVAGSVLESVGLSMPLLHPDEAVVLLAERL
jgi:alpha-galactosidase